MPGVIVALECEVRGAGAESAGDGEDDEAGEEDGEREGDDEGVAGEAFVRGMALSSCTNEAK